MNLALMLLMTGGSILFITNLIQLRSNRSLIADLEHARKLNRQLYTSYLAELELSAYWYHAVVRGQTPKTMPPVKRWP